MESPIGFFDSGIGGTSIWKEVVKLLPHEQTIYLADSANAPYGEKSNKKITELSVKNTEFLLNRGCKLIVVACNTATTAAIDHLRANYTIPFIGIEPAIKPAAIQSKTGRIGVLATKGTLSSNLFYNTSKLYADEVQVIEQEGTHLVELIEAGQVTSERTKNLVWQYVQPMIDKGIDALVLGCTHYPYLIPILKDILPKEVQLIDSGEAVARQTKKVLESNAMLNLNSQLGTAQFYYNTKENCIADFVPSTENVKINYLDF